MRNAMIALATLLVGVSLGLPSFAAAWATPGAACTQEGANANSDGFLTCTGGVWVSNAVLMGTTSATCDSTKAGYIRYTGGKFEGCNGTGWIQLAGGSKPSSYAGKTTTSYAGNMGGMAGANAKCVAQFPGSRMMKLNEVVFFGSVITSSGWVYHSEIDNADGSFKMGGCEGFNNGNSTYYGAYLASGGKPYYQSCNTSIGIHCVID